MVVSGIYPCGEIEPATQNITLCTFSLLLMFCIMKIDVMYCNIGNFCVTFFFLFSFSALLARS